MQVQVEVVEHRREEVDTETGRSRSWVEVEELEVLDLTGAPLAKLTPTKARTQAMHSPSPWSDDDDDDEEEQGCQRSRYTEN